MTPTIGKLSFNTRNKHQFWMFFYFQVQNAFDVTQTRKSIEWSQNEHH